MRAKVTKALTTETTKKGSALTALSGLLLLWADDLGLSGGTVEKILATAAILGALATAWGLRKAIGRLIPKE